MYIFASYILSICRCGCDTAAYLADSSERNDGQRTCFFDDVSVLWNGESILDIIEGRYLTFRSTTENDHWIGTKYKKGTDMGFSYQEDNICGIINQSIETSQDDWSFKIVLEGKKAIAYPGFEEQLTGAEIVYEPAVRDGNIITGRGMGGSIDFALKIVAYLTDEKTAAELAEKIVYTK